MMHRSKKLLVSGDREYFNEKRSVNVRVKGTAHLAESFGSCAETGFAEITLGESSSVVWLYSDWTSGSLRRTSRIISECANVIRPNPRRACRREWRLYASENPSYPEGHAGHTIIHS